MKKNVYPQYSIAYNIIFVIAISILFIILAAI